jgi:hypothetical protein
MSVPVGTLAQAPANSLPSFIDPQQSLRKAMYNPINRDMGISMFNPTSSSPPRPIQIEEEKSQGNDSNENSNNKAEPSADLLWDDTGRGGSNTRRTKERKISFVIEKVSLWRKLYNGIQEGNKIMRYSLEDAAKKVNISKKSLDDYLL